MKNLFALVLLLTTCLAASAQTAANTWSVKFSDAIIARWPTTINNMTGKNWEYSNSIITHGMEKVYLANPTPAYRTYIKGYIDPWLNATGGFVGVSLTSLDRVHPGISVLFLYEQFKSNAADSTKYRNAATTLRNLIVGPTATYSKTGNGILWHKLSGYNNISMLDGMYMAHPFLAKYGRLFNDNAAIDTAVNQVLFMYNQLYDGTTHLIKHAWTSTPGSYTWANATTGNSSEVWSRAMGWYVMAITDILKYLPTGHAKRPQLLTALNNLAQGIKTYQDATTGLWYQVVDKGVGKPGYTTANYIESSGSAMFVYALKTASDSGWISSATYLPVAQAGWNGLKANEITIYSGDSKPQINNFAPAMSVQNDYASYVGITSVDCPTTTNPHGYAAILMAAAVMEFPLSLLPVHFTDVGAQIVNHHATVCWTAGDNDQADHFVVQGSLDGKQFDQSFNISTNASGNYCWTDARTILPGRTYYRIAAVSKDGTMLYSKTLSLQSVQSTVALRISPNPVQSGSAITVSANVAAAGVYRVHILSADGAVIRTNSFTLSAGQNDLQVEIPLSVSKGMYRLQLEGNDARQSSGFLVY
jgi:unsaturated rhamnogalacturonyl hydrolase